MHRYRMIVSCMGMVLTTAIVLGMRAPSQATPEELAPPSITGSRRQSRELREAQRYLEARKNFKRAGNSVERDRALGVIVQSSRTLREVPTAPMDISIPIARAALPTDAALPSEERVLARAGFDESRKLYAQTNAAYWNPNRMALLEKTMRLFRQQNLRYRESSEYINFVVVQDATRLVRIVQDDQEHFEVRIDEALMHLIDEMDLGPFMTLVLGHEWNHALLSELRLGEHVEPLLEETAVNAVDLLTFSRMRKPRRDLVLEALARLEESGFLTGPYREFLRGVLPQNPADEPAGSLPFPWRQNPTAFFTRAYAISTHPQVNAGYAARQQALREGLPAGYSVDYQTALETWNFSGLKGRLTQAHRRGRLLDTVLHQMEAMVVNQTKTYEDARKNLFARFQMSVYKPGGGPINASVEADILQDDLPRIAALGGPSERERLRKILRTTDYSMSLRIAVARTLVQIASPPGFGRVKNPFFLRALLEYSQDLRRTGRFVKANEAEIRDILLLLGHAGIEDHELYLAIRSEIAAWILHSQYAMHRSQPPDPHSGQPWQHINKGRFRMGQRLFEHAEAMLKLARADLQSWLGEPTIDEETWNQKIQEISVLLDPADAQTDSSLGPELLEELARELPLAQRARASLRELLKDPRPLRESIYLGYGVLLDEEQVSQVRVGYLGRGMFKFTYQIEVVTPQRTYVVVRNFIKESASEAIDKEKEVSPIAFSFVQDEVYRMMIASPQIFETLYWYGRQDDHTFWDEEFVKGRPLFDARNMAGPHDLDRRPGEDFFKWKRRVLRGMRRYVALCFEAWDRGGRNSTMYDINPWNVTVDDEAQRLIDAGMYAVGSTRFIFYHNLADYWQWIRGILENIQGHYPLIATQEIIPEVHAGVLDALGEKEGLKVLEGIREDLEATYEDQERMAEEFGWVLEELEAYVQDGHSAYVPQILRRPLSAGEQNSLQANAQRFSFEYYFKVQRSWEHAQDSPWLWAHIQRVALVESAGGYPNLSNQERRLADALERLIERIRRWPQFVQDSRRSARDRWLREASDQFSLTQEQITALHQSVSYPIAVRSILDEHLSQMLLENGYDPQVQYQNERREVIDVVLNVSLNPEAAATGMSTLMKDPRHAFFLDALQNPKGSSVSFIVPHAFDNFFWNLKENGFLDEDNLVEVLRFMEPEYLHNFLATDRYHDKMRKFLLRDYQRVARSYNSLIRKDRDRAAELASFSLVEEKTGTWGAAYLLDAMGEVDTQQAWVEAIVGYAEVTGSWNLTWRGIRAETPEAIRRLLVPRAAQVLSRYYRVDPVKARGLLTSLLASLSDSLQMDISFLGEGEVIDLEGNRLKDLLHLLRKLPSRYWLGTLRSLTPRKATQLLSVYGNLLGNYYHLIEELPGADAEEERLQLRGEFERLGGFLEALNFHRPSIVTGTLRYWLASEDLPLVVFEEWIRQAPSHTLRDILLHYAATSPSVLESFLVRLPHLEDDAVRNRLVDIFARLEDDLRERIPTLELADYVPTDRLILRSL